jgi:hypothetical protein
MAKIDNMLFFPYINFRWNLDFLGFWEFSDYFVKFGIFGVLYMVSLGDIQSKIIKILHSVGKICG